MTLHTITIQFDTPAEQKKVQIYCGLAIVASETWQPKSGYKSWTEFDISGCEPSDIEKYFGGLN